MMKCIVCHHPVDRTKLHLNCGNCSNYIHLNCYQTDPVTKQRNYTQCQKCQSVGQILTDKQHNCVETILEK